MGIRQGIIAVWRARCLSPGSIAGHVRLAPDGSLRGFGRCARLYGVAPFADLPTVSQVQAALAAALTAQPRWRVVSVDADGYLAIVLRCEGRNQAIALLRAGLVRCSQNALRRYRRAQVAAQTERLGLWRDGDLLEKSPSTARLALSPFPWWQG